MSGTDEFSCTDETVAISELLAEVWDQCGEGTVQHGR